MNDARARSSPPTKLQQLLGLLIMVMGLAGFFAGMAYFDLFGKDIQYNGKELVPACFLMFGMYGMGHAFGGRRLGLKYAGVWTILVIAAALIGALRHYR